jgi:predicted RNase H-like HicB family nuclease
MLQHFTLIYWTDDGWQVGRLKEVPGVFSQGKTLKQLEANIRDAYRLMMEDAAEDVPKSDTQTKKMVLAV